MATLNTITLDADGTLDTTNLSHDAGTGLPWFSHCNDTPNGGSSDFVQSNAGLVDGVYTAWFSLSDVNANFGSMDTLNIDVDVGVSGTVTNDTVLLTARIFDADNVTTNPLTDESGTLGSHADTTRTQRNVAFSNLAGTKANWNSAHIRFTWTYDRITGVDAFNLRLYGCAINGTYTAAAAADHRMLLLQGCG